MGAEMSGAQEGLKAAQRRFKLDTAYARRIRREGLCAVEARVNPLHWSDSESRGVFHAVSDGLVEITPRARWDLTDAGVEWLRAHR